MKEVSPKRIAWLTTLVSSVVTGVILAPVFYVIGEPEDWIFYAICLSLSFLSSFVIFFSAMERFIHGKVKLIYKTIHKEKTGPGIEADGLEMDQDVMGNVNREVIKWAQENRAEINELKAQAKFRREFIGNLAHELKTPLFNIQGYLFTLIEGGLEDKTINKDYLERADKNLERLIDLVKDLDSITKLESGSMDLSIERFDMVELIKDTIKALDYQARDRDIQLTLDKKYEKPTYVMADQGKIQQVVVNLVINSINYGVEKGETRFKLYDMDENVLVEIEDNGIGISKEHLPRLFERFYRVDKSRARNYGGTGLGLAIVKHLIESHNQTINVRSEVGKGSTFSFTLKKASN